MKKPLAFLLGILIIISLVGCGDDASQTESESAYDTRITWENITELPSGFPKLCDSVTTVRESYSEEKSVSVLYWALLDEADYNAYIASIEDWTGAKFGEAASDGSISLTAVKGAETITVTAAYDSTATGKFLEGGNYDSQARIEVVTAR